ncbi:MAG: oxidoreductase [Candidatus Peribacteria bacterium]|nr:oxidoreductase [Candidatus Peribacteria bacterium]
MPEQVQTQYNVTPGTGSVLDTVSADGIMSLGKQNAPLTITLVTHPSCAYCRTFQEELLPRLRTDFIDTGLIKLQFIILPIQKYPESEMLHAAVQCAAAQQKGFAVLNRLFEAPKTRDDLIKTAAAAGADEALFTACLDRVPLSVTAEDTLIREFKVTLVPTVIVQSQASVGFPSYADLRGSIDEALQKYASANR